MKCYNLSVNSAYLITSHNRLTQTKAQIDLIKNLYSKYPTLSNIDIFHAYNGDHNSYPEPYFGEEIIRRENPGHFRGAVDLLNSGMEIILKSKNYYKYIIVASGDVWWVNPKAIIKVINDMEQNGKLLYTSIWFINAYSTEFFIKSN